MFLNVYHTAIQELARNCLWGERKAHMLQALNRSSFSCYVIDFKPHKQLSRSGSSAAHLHFKPAHTASPAADRRSASLPPAGFIWGERVSRSGEGRVDGEPAPDQEQGNYTVLVLSYAVWMARWEKPLKHGEGCHMPAKCASMATHADPLSDPRTLRLYHRDISAPCT